MSKVKPFLLPVLTGLLILAIMAICFLHITLDFQIILMLGIGIFLAAGYGNSSLDSPMLYKLLAINLPFSLAFYVLVLAQIPHIWYFLLLFLCSTVLGIFIRKKSPKPLMISTVVFLLLSLFISWKYVPQHISQSLGTELAENIDPFSLTSMEGTETKSSELRGQVVVLDFFATWCKPCILELKELEKVNTHFTEEEVKFYVVNSEIGGDTRDKMQAYIDKTNYPFTYIFDAKRKLYEFFGFKGLGVPVLLILDKEGKLRFKHWGFNEGESQFAAQMVERIEALLAE